VPTSDLPVLWICGPPAAGKSVTAWSLFERVAGEGGTVAYLDIDQVGMLYPASEDDAGRHRLKAGALRALIPNYYASGAQALVVSGVIDPRSAAQVAGRHAAADVTFCLLDTDQAVLRQRVRERGGDPAEADAAVADAAALRDAGFVDASIVTTGLSVEQVVDRVRPLVRTLESRARDTAPAPSPSPAATGVVVVTGARAVGTSTIGFGLARHLWSRQVSTGFADLDQLAFLRTGGGADPAATSLGVRNLARLHEHFAAHGAARLVVSAHLRASAQHRAVRMAAPRAEVTVVRLRADEETIAAHVRRRWSGREARLAGDDLVGAPPTRQQQVIRIALSEQEALDARHDEDLVVDVSGRSSDAVIGEVTDRVSSAHDPQ
jgi:adenylylsulfate kinase-like enzyme